MKIEEFYNAPKYAGIYCFKNKTNGKCYIGQAVKLRKRLLHHLSNFRCERYDAPLYNAFKKYGLENFELSFLDTFKGEGLTKRIKNTLDELEIKYIKEYNSYGATGYNQTVGGDPGILGYHMTDVQKEKMSKAKKEAAEDGRYLIYIYDTVQKCYYTFINSIVAANFLKIPFLRNNMRDLLHCGRYISSRNTEDLNSKIEKFKNKVFHKREGKYVGGVFKISEEEFMKVYNLPISNKEKMEKLNICKKTYYNYLHEFNLISKGQTKEIPIIQYSLDMIPIREWKSATEIMNTLGFDKSGIAKCCKGKRKTVHNYIWKYK